LPRLQAWRLNPTLRICVHTQLRYLFEDVLTLGAVWRRIAELEARLRTEFPAFPD
jgi:hypothetical protein